MHSSRIGGRFKVAAISIVAIATLALSACSGTSAPAASTSSDSRPTITVGVLGEFTGAYAQFATLLKVGTTMAAQDVNANNSYKYKIKLVDYDCTDQAAVCVTQARQAIDDHVSVVFGPALSSNILGTEALLATAHIPQFAFLPTVTALTNPPGNVFRFDPLETASATLAANLAKSKGYKTAGIITANNPSGVEMSGAADAAFKKVGITVKSVQAVALGTADFTPQTIAASKGVDALFVYSTSPNDEGSIIRIAKENGFNGQVYTNGVTGLVGLSNGAAAGAISLSAWFPTKDTNAKWLKRATSLSNGVGIGLQAAAGYDGTIALAQILTKYGSSSADIVKGLENLKNFKAFSGNTYSFSATNRDGSKLPNAYVNNANGTYSIVK